MSVLNPTRRDKLLDARHRPYFLWDVDMTLEAFRSSLSDQDPNVRAHLMGKLMRQAKPDDVFAFVSMADILVMWPRVTRYLGKTLPFWTWLLETWKARKRKLVMPPAGR